MGEDIRREGTKPIVAIWAIKRPCVEGKRMLEQKTVKKFTMNRPGFTGGQNSRRIARYGTESKEDLKAVFT